MAKKFLNALKGAFVTVIPDEPKAEEAKVEKVQPVVNPQLIKPVIPTPSNEQMFAGQVDSNILENLCMVLDEKNIPGPDYLELKSAANDEQMKNAIPDEKNRFLCAYISMKANAQTLTKETIIGSIDKYIEYLEIERETALSELALKWKEEVEDKEALVETAQKELVELQEALNAKIKFISETNSEIANSKNQCAINKANFNSTVEYIINGLNADKIKLNEILKD